MSANPATPTPAIPAKKPRGSTEARALLAGLTDLAARAGHDMVGPLNQAGSLLALLIKRYRGKIDSDADQLLDFLHSASLRMEGVIDGLRGYVESVGKPPVYGDVDLNQAFATALDRLQSEIAESGAVVTADPLPRAWADGSQIAIVFQQLLGNAIKFRNEGMAARIHVSCVPAGEMLAIQVRDEGIGIDPEHQDAIFQPFRRLNGREYPGAGLGLSAVKTIIEMHGGSVRLVPRPEVDASTCIEFSIPAM
jgi:light-regulated signal transduction histidine kinase (bacteriophytochrome)